MAWSGSPVNLAIPWNLDVMAKNLELDSFLYHAWNRFFVENSLCSGYENATFSRASKFQKYRTFKRDYGFSILHLQNLCFFKLEFY